MRRVVAAGVLGCVLACASRDREPLPSSTGVEVTVTSSGNAAEFLEVETTTTLHGVVQSPNTLFPIAGALVYVTDAVPDEQARCGSCRTLERRHYAVTDADGRFTIRAPSGSHFIVTEKGRFRRVRAIDVPRTETTLPEFITRLPARDDDGGFDRAPHIAIVRGGADPLELSFAKFGLGDAPVQTFDEPSQLITDPVVLSSFDIVMLPCGDGWELAIDAAVEKNLREFVAGGGRLFVSDYRYDYAHFGWPGFFRWEERGSAFARGPLCLGCGSLYEAPAIVDDSDLRKWLAGVGAKDLVLHEAYTKLVEVRRAWGRDSRGVSVEIEPKVWLSAKLEDGRRLPAVVSLDDGCGRLVVTTHHTEAGGSRTMLPQELVMLYVLFDDVPCVAARVPATPR